jgi:CO/xanthine dehydrogenase Mo-binding subunit
VGRAVGRAKDDSDLENGLQAATYFQASSPTFPFGSHVAVVEVDTETGQVRHLRHVACDDAGTVLNPCCSKADPRWRRQGTAQALLEEVRYDSDGNPITSNLADYAFISAAELSSIEVVHMETPTFVNPGRQGHRRERHDRFHTRRTVRRRRRPQPPRSAAHRHACTAERVWKAIEATR